MVRRCTSCHRYLTGSPQPGLDHPDVNGGPHCTLAHHPSPCDFVDSRDRPCSFYEDLVSEEADHVHVGASTTHDSSEPSAYEVLEGRVAQLQRE